MEKSLTIEAWINCESHNFIWKHGRLLVGLGELRAIAKTIGGLAVAVLLTGVLVFFYGGGFPPSSVNTQNNVAVSTGASTVALASATKVGIIDANQYGCALPAINTQLFCDKLPAGYQIPGKSPNAPTVHCPSGMSASACNLLKQTMFTGVCTPNETPVTDPFDCGCSGALVNDPYLGRCAAPAAICQIVGNQDNPQP